MGQVLLAALGCIAGVTNVGSGGATQEVNDVAFPDVGGRGFGVARGAGEVGSEDIGVFVVMCAWGADGGTGDGDAVVGLMVGVGWGGGGAEGSGSLMSAKSFCTRSKTRGRIVGEWPACTLLWGGGRRAAARLVWGVAKGGRRRVLLGTDGVLASARLKGRIVGLPVTLAWMVGVQARLPRCWCTAEIGAGRREVLASC